MTATARFLVSLHDVTPRHAQAVEDILDFLKLRDIPPVPLLVVPHFHGQWSLEDHPEFVRKLKAWRDAGHELVLHGFEHRESPEDAQVPSGAMARFKRRFLTAGEGEFLALDEGRARHRLRRGLESWSTCDLDMPRGFVAPAWLFRRHLPETLWSMGFSWTEDHHRIHFSDRPAVECPVISWASRDPARRIGSRVFAQAALSHWSDRPLVRIALHPHDWDHPTLVRSIDETLRKALRTRRAIGSPLEI